MPDAATIFASPDRPALLDLSRAVDDVPMVVQLREMAERSGRTPMAVVREFGRLTLGRGKPSFSDFVRLRLFDPAVAAEGGLDAFVGQRLNRNLCVAINYRHDWLGLMANKVASSAYLASFGLPTARISAIFAPGMRSSRANLLGSAEDLEAFLLTPDNYPLFGKPIESYQSLGSVALVALDGLRRELIRFDGSSVPVTALVSEIQTHYARGYVFQPMLAPHPDIQAICGTRLATARIITIATETGPEVFRACWKIPAGLNVADNYWRPGNLLAQLDLASGEVKRATSGSGLRTTEHITHPDTGAALVGVRHPGWTGMLDLACDGARAMHHVPLIGWDIAHTTEGPVIIEMNETPDFFLPQFADRRGVLDDRFSAFQAYQAKQAEQHRRVGKALVAKL